MEACHSTASDHSLSNGRCLKYAVAIQHQMHSTAEFVYLTKLKQLHDREPLKGREKTKIVVHRNRLAKWISWLERATSVSWKIYSCGEFYKAALSRLWKSANLITCQPHWQIKPHGLLKPPPECRDSIIFSMCFILYVHIA